jgi:hypothetical protein
LLGLDSSYPYAPDGGVLEADDSNLGWPDNDSDHVASDSPARELIASVSNMTINESFKTYMMYRPKASVIGNQWVPLHRIAWSWNANVNRPVGGWVPATPSGTITVAEDARCKTHPIWNRVNTVSEPWLP